MPSPTVQLRLSSQDGDVAPLSADHFVLYDSGLVFLQRRRDGISKFYSVQLSSDEVRRLLGEVGVEELLSLDETWYPETALSSHLGMWTIAFPSPQTGTVDSRTVRGSFSASGEWGLYSPAPPPAFQRAVRKLITYSHPKEQPWFPPYFIVDLRAPASSKIAGCPWPEDWEDLDSPGSVRLAPDKPGGTSDYGTIRVVGTRLTEIQAFLRDCAEHQVQLRGKAVWLGFSVRLQPQSSAY